MVRVQSDQLSILVSKSVESIEWFGGGRGNLSSLFETLTLGVFREVLTSLQW